MLDVRKSRLAAQTVSQFIPQVGITVVIPAVSQDQPFIPGHQHMIHAVILLKEIVVKGFILIIF